MRIPQYYYYYWMQDQYQKHKNLELLKKALNINGYLHKKSRSLLSKYRKRFFMIMGDKLAYFTDQSLKDFRKEFNFKQIRNITTCGQDIFSFYYQINDKEEKEYLFKADSPEIRNKWAFNLNLILDDVSSSKQLTKSLENERPRIIVKKYSQQVDVQPDIRFVFKKLKLTLLDQKFHQDYIKCRIARHFNGKEVLFLVSCKSLDKQIFDESILSKEHMGKFDFNVLYKYNIETHDYYQIMAAENIKEISLEKNILKINNHKEIVTLKNTSIYSFIEKLKRSISIGAEYRNNEGIALKQNIDYLVDLFEQPENRLRNQHLQLKLEDQFIFIKNQNKNYKETYEQFVLFARQLINKVEDILNAIKLKKKDLSELSCMILKFYEQKIYKLLRTFWSENSETMTIEDLVSMTIVSNNFYNIISQYAVDRNKTVVGIKFLRDTFLKKMIAESEVDVKQLTKNDKLFVSGENGNSQLPLEFIRVMKGRMFVLNNCDCHETVIEESKQLLIEAIVIVLTNQLQTKVVLNNFDEKLLILEINNTWLYEELLEKQFMMFDLTQINHCIFKFRKMLVRKLFSKCYSEKKKTGSDQSYIVTNQYFLDMNIQKYTKIMNQYISKLQNMSSRTETEINERLSDDFNTYYLKSLVNASEKETIFVNVLGEIIEKIEKDEIKVKSLFPEASICKITAFFNCIKPIFDDKDTEQKVKERFIELKFNIFPDDFRKSDYKSLLSLKGTFTDLDALISELDSVILDTDYDEKTTQSDVDQSSFISFSSLNCSTIRPRRQTNHKTQAEILINDDIDLQGYLKKKTICPTQLGSCNQQFVEEYFKLNSEFLLWYKNSNSQNLLDRIFLKQIKKVDIFPDNPEEFFIILNNGMRYEFKTGTLGFASKWVSKMNNTNLQSSFVKSESMKNVFSSDSFVNLFENDEKKFERPSLLSNYRDNEHSRLIDYDSSESPIKPKPMRAKKKKFTFGQLFGCVSLQ